LKIRLALASLALIFTSAVLGCFWLWQPERQVWKHQTHLLDAAENRSWSRFNSFIDPAYSDRWKHDKAFITRETREWLRQFFALTIRREVVSQEMPDSTHAIIRARLRLEGNGTALAQMAQDEVNGITEAFVFEWTRKSWKPWDWQLTRADNPQLNIPPP